MNIVFLTKSYSEFPWTQSQFGMSNKYRVVAETEQVNVWVFFPLVKEEQNWFTLWGSVSNTVTVLKNNTDFYLFAFDPRNYFLYQKCLFISHSICR